jgi:hypothetical protein
MPGRPRRGDRAVVDRKNYTLLVFIEHSTRRMRLGGGTAPRRFGQSWQWPAGDRVGVGSREAEHAQQVFGDLVGGLRVVTLGVIVQELAQA